jgi:hypothetical protein
VCISQADYAAPGFAVEAKLSSLRMFLKNPYRHFEKVRSVDSGAHDDRCVRRFRHPSSRRSQVGVQLRVGAVGTVIEFVSGVSSCGCSCGRRLSLVVHRFAELFCRERFAVEQLQQGIVHVFRRCVPLGFRVQSFRLNEQFRQ